MTVAELIAELQKIPEHKEVLVHVFRSDITFHDAELPVDAVEYRGPDVLLEVK